MRPHKESVGRSHTASRVLPVDSYAFILVGIAVGVRWWAAAAGWFSQDDFLFTSGSVGHPLTWGYLFQDYNGHLMPGGFLWVWVQTHVAPMDHQVSVAVQVLLFLITSVAFYRLLRYLFGSRLFVLLPLAFYLFGAMTLTSYLWWSAALNHQPMQLAMVLAIHAHVRHLRTGQRRYVALAALAYLGGLSFFEKAGLILPVLYAMTALWFTPEAGARRWTAALSRNRFAWAVYLVPTAVFGAIYLAQVHSPLTTGRPSLGDAGGLLRTTAGESVIPSLFGGPWQWSPVGVGGVAGADPTAVLLCLVALIVVFVESIRRIPGAWRSWAFAGGYVALDVLLVWGGRLVFVGPLVGREYRYVADAAIPIALSVGFLLEGAAAELPDLQSRSRARSLATYAVVGFVASSIYTTQAYVQLWSANPAKAYFETNQSEIGAREGRLSIFDGGVPQDVLWALAFPRNKLSYVLKPFPERPHFDDPAFPLQVIDDQGHVRDAYVRPARTILHGPDGACGYRVRDGSAFMPLDGPLFAWDWTVRVAYLAAEPADGYLVLGDSRTPIHLKQGLNAVFVRHNGTFSSLSLVGLPASAEVCVTEGVVGIPEPMPGPPSS